MALIITEKCIGCSACRKTCPTGAISGEIKEVHTIDPNLCIECGACGRVCPEEAVRTEDGVFIKKLKKSLWIKPVIIEEKCYACENCVAVCPVNALSMVSESLPLQENAAVLSAPERCVSCGWCFDNCQFDAILFGGDTTETHQSDTAKEKV